MKRGKSRQSTLSLRQSLVLGTAVATTAFMGGYVRRAYALCSGAGGTYTCSGALNTTQTLNGTPLTVTTTPGFSIDTTGSGGDAFTLTGTGGLSFTDENTSTITGGATGISATNNTSGALTITTTGTVTGTGIGPLQGGIVAYNNAGTTDLTIEAATVSGGANGIRAANFGTGALSITATGTVTGAGFDGILVDAGTDITGITINVAAVSGNFYGISLTNIAGNVGAGVVSITATGTVTGTNRVGINVFTSAETTDLTVEVVDVSGGTYGIRTDHDGTGVLSITATGTVTGTTRHGIDATTTDASTGLTIEAVDVSGGGYGVRASHDGSGELKITTTGTVVGATRFGITAFTSNASSTGLTIDAVNVTGEDVGIQAGHTGSGVLSITANGTVTGTNEFGIYTRRFGANVAGNVTDIDVTSSGVVQGDIAGINAISDAGQAIAITNAGQVRNLSVQSFDLAIQSSGGPADIDNSGLVTGTVSLGDLVDAFDNTGTWNTAGGENFFGAGDDVLNNEATGLIIAASQAGTAENTIFTGLETFNHAGTLTLQDGGTGDVTRTSGNFVGEGGAVIIDTFLGTDNSPTDLLVINGDTTGTATLFVHNAGGPGALTTGDGIKVVQVDGLSDGEFVLGAPVIAGAFEYNLFQGGITDPDDGDWYLRNGGLAPSTPPYEAYPQILLGLIELPTLQQRVGNRYWAQRHPGEPKYSKDSWDAPEATIEGSGLWGRIVGSHGHFEADSSTTSSEYDADGWKIQAGFDGLLTESEAGDRLIGGVTVQYGETYADIFSDLGDGSIDAKGYGVGLTATWYHQNGFYLDSQALAAWLDGDISSDEVGELVDGNDGFGYALSLEAGKRFDVGENLTLTPQAQLVYSDVDFDDFEGPFADEVSLEDGDSLEGRLGLSLDRQASWQDEEGETSRSHFYGIANVLYEFLDGSEVSVNGTELSSEPQDLWGEIGFGGSHNWNDDKYSIYGEGSASTSLVDFGDSYALKGTIGLRVSW